MNARDVENITLALSAWGGGQLVAPFEEIAERARVVGVLDAYGRSIGASPPQVHPRPDGSFHLVYPVQVDGSSLFEWRTVYGASEDAARAAAAKAIESGEVSP